MAIISVSQARCRRQEGKLIFPPTLIRGMISLFIHLPTHAEQPLMNDVFISYSRKDAAFAKRLFDKLESTGRESWIDWEGIPLTSDWWAEICKGIDEAATFVFIMSPDSLASPVCTLEVAHAIAVQKRIIPVVYRESPAEEAFGRIAAARVDSVLGEMLKGRHLLMVASDNWTKLGHINWVFFRETDDFEAAFKMLVDTIEVDLAYRARYTRLEIQARNWQHNEESNDLLLIGDQISAAEQWLAESQGKTPEPTKLHLDYITTSRRADNKNRAYVASLQERSIALESQKNQLEQETHQAVAENSRLTRRTRLLRYASFGFGGLAIAAILVMVLATVAATNARSDRDAARDTVVNVNRQITAVGHTLTPAAQLLGTANAEREDAVQELTPLANTLQVGQTRIANADERLATAEVVLDEAIAAGASEATSAAEAREQVTVAYQTLTPIPQTLTLVAETLQAGQTQIADADKGLATATYAQGTAQMQADMAQTEAAIAREEATNVQVTVQAASMELAAIQATGTVIAVAVDERTRLAESRRLALSAQTLLNAGNGDVQLAALLGIRALQSGYSPEADEALASALAKLPASFKLGNPMGYQEFAYAVEYSPDGQTIATGGCAEYDARFNCIQGIAILFDGHTGTEIRRFEKTSRIVVSIAFSPDGKYLLTGAEGGTILLWDVATATEIRSFQPFYSFENVNSVAFSQDGQFVFAAISGRIDIWFASDGRPFASIPDIAPKEPYSSSLVNEINALAVSPQGRFVMGGYWDGVARLWDLETNEEVREFDAHTGGITSVVYSNDGSRILTGSYDGTARLWNVETGEEIMVFSGHEAGVTSVAFSPNNELILTGSSRGTITLGSLNGPDTTARLWDIETGSELMRFYGLTAGISEVAFSPTGDSIVTGNFGFAQVWNLTKPTIPARVFDHPDPVVSMDFNADFRILITSSIDKRVRIWNAESGILVQEVDPHAEGVGSVLISPDAQYALVIGCENYEIDPSWHCAQPLILVWDVRASQERRRIYGHENFVYGADISPDGQTFVTVGDDGTARLWDSTTGVALWVYASNSDLVRSAAFSSDGKHIVLSECIVENEDPPFDCKRSRITVIDAEEGLETQEFHVEITGTYLSDAKVSGNGEVVFGVGHDTIYIWSVLSGELVKTISLNAVSTVNLQPSGQLLIASTGGGSVSVWNWSTGELIRQINGGTQPSESTVDWAAADAKFIGDGSWFALANWDGVSIWELDYQDYVNYACGRIGRDFTDAERAQYDITDAAPTCPQFAAP